MDAGEALVAAAELADKTAAGYDTMTSEAKAIYDTEKLAFMDKLVKACEAKEGSNDCMFAKE